MPGIFGRDKPSYKNEPRDEQDNFIDNQKRAKNYQTFSNAQSEQKEEKISLTVIDELSSKFDELEQLNQKIKSEKRSLNGSIESTVIALVVNTILNKLSNSADEKVKELLHLTAKLEIESKSNEKIKKLGDPFHELVEKISKSSYEDLKSSLSSSRYTELNRAVLSITTQHKKLFHAQHEELFPKPASSHPRR